jgi:hypothetical protein
MFFLLKNRTPQYKTLKKPFRVARNGFFSLTEIRVIRLKFVLKNLIIGLSKSPLNF